MPTRCRQRAHSLIEALAAITLVGGSLVAGIQLFGAQAAIATTSSQRGEAIAILNREIERALATPYEFHRTTTFAPVPDNPEYSIRTVVTLLETRVREVRVEVRFTPPSGQVQTLSVAALSCQGIDS